MDSQRTVTTAPGENSPEQPIEQKRPRRQNASGGQIKQGKSKTQGDSKRKRKKKKNYHHMIPVLILVALILIGIVGVMGYQIWNSQFREVNLNELTVISTEGFSGKAVAKVSVDAMPEYQEFFRTVTATLDKTEGLSNGDVITVSFDFDNKLARQNKLRISSEESEITVEGLIEATELTDDLIFRDLSITQEGISPKVFVTLENQAEEEFLQNVVYTVENEKTCYREGDVLTITATFDPEVAKECCYDVIQDSYTKSYEVHTEQQYLTSPDGISSDLLQKMISKGGSIILQDDPAVGGYGLRIFSERHLQPQWIGRTTTFTWSGPRVLSAYFNAVTEEAAGMKETHANDVKIAYEATLSQADGTSCQAEIIVQYTDLILSADGTVEIDLDSGKIAAVSAKNSNIKSVISDDSGYYETTKLTIE